MRQSKFFTGKIGRCLIPLAILTTLAITLDCCYQLFFLTPVVEAQVRRQPGKPRPKRNPQTRILAATFNHETHRDPKIKLNCSNCHTIPAHEFPDEIAAATKSSIKGYPYHDSCLDNCHRTTAPQFFRGASPIICTVCHTRVSPRTTARDMSPFPKHDEPAMELEFPGYFPHNKHPIPAASPSPSASPSLSCETCHKKDDRVPILIAASGEVAFKPSEGSFMTSPTGHASCFGCHWDIPKPGVHFFPGMKRGLRLSDDCAGCHLTPKEVAQKPRNQLTPNTREWFENWPREWPKRVSLKFNHESRSHKQETCTACHSNIAQMETLDIAKAELPIRSCWRCHRDREPTPDSPSIYIELMGEEQDVKEGKNNDPSAREGKHTCKGCHTRAVAIAPPPCNHYELFGDYFFERYPKVLEPCRK
jgi:hypothetical protein